jgi:hypothetical protein
MAEAKKPKHAGKTMTQGSHRVTMDANHSKLEKALEAAKWGQSPLTEFLKSADENTKITFLQQRGFFELLDSLAELLWKASREVSYHDIPGFVVCLLFYRCIGSFFAAIRLASAGQLAECYAQLRVCLESAVYMFAIHKEPALADAWINRHDDEKSHELCQRSFRIGELFKMVASDNKSIHAEAKALYDQCIDLGGHPNERSLTVNIKLSRAERKMALELLNTEPTPFQVCLANCCLVGLSAAKILGLVFVSQFAKVNADLRIANVRKQLQRIAPALLLGV